MIKTINNETSPLLPKSKLLPITYHLPPSYLLPITNPPIAAILRQSHLKKTFTSSHFHILTP